MELNMIAVLMGQVLGAAVVALVIYLWLRPRKKRSLLINDDIQHPCDIQFECRLPFMQARDLGASAYYRRDVQMPYWIGVVPWTAEETTGVRFHFVSDRCHGVSNFGDDGSQIWSDAGWDDPDLAWCDFVHGYAG